MPIRLRLRVVAALAVALSVVACTGGANPSPSAPLTTPAVGSGTPAATPAATRVPPPSAAASPSDAGSPAPSASATGWRLLEAGNGPGAREDHTWTVQPGSRTAWLFGGRDGSDAFNDLWRLDLEIDEWQRIEPVAGPAPEPRFGHAALWIDGLGLVVWSGQGGPSTFFDDLWVFDTNTGAWSELPAGDERPAARYGSCMAIGPDNRLWVSHGFTEDAGRFDDTWAYDVLAGAWERIPRSEETPPIRCLHDCLWTPDGRFVLYAGQTTGVPAIGDLWIRGVDAGWTRGPDAGAPPARQLYALASSGATAWVWGGGGERGEKLADLWQLDLTTLGWTELQPPGEGPTGRSGATLIVDPDRERLLLFGGLTEDGTSFETLELGMTLAGG